MNTDRLNSRCACVSMYGNGGTKQKVNAFFFATLYKAVSKFMIITLSQCEWPRAGEENQKKNTSVLDLQKYTRNFVPASSTQFAVLLSILCLADSLAWPHPSQINSLVLGAIWSSDLSRLTHYICQPTTRRIASDKDTEQPVCIQLNGRNEQLNQKRTRRSPVQF